ncbi:hypothetical protein N7519_004232 [Penicillium mononematosum]|uniref:uncharacterized protein n=1 Tax=Penicillium mononematosum TaxID=268346 RepID=UPI002548C6BF|nr:uncharacterized protein N7519_004232 [Penicillium mononematosum]KAJ6189324.1 hypothetical protein N7519_004232 [Penicillium mononematosum]
MPEVLRDSPGIPPDSPGKPVTLRVQRGTRRFPVLTWFPAHDPVSSEAQHDRSGSTSHQALLNLHTPILRQSSKH